METFPYERVFKALTGSSIKKSQERTISGNSGFGHLQKYTVFRKKKMPINPPTERNTIYKGVETFPYRRVFKASTGSRIKKSKKKNNI